MEPEFFGTKELDQRKADNLTVTLRWVKNTMGTFVAVLDTRVNPPVEHMIEVPNGQLALFEENPVQLILFSEQRTPDGAA